MMLFIQVAVLGGLTALVLLCIGIAVWVANPFWLPTSNSETKNQVTLPPTHEVSLVPTFTITPAPLPETPTETPTPIPTQTPVPTFTVTPLLPEETATATQTFTPIPPTSTPILESSAQEETLVSETEVPASENPPAPDNPFDFIVTQQRLRSNEENSWAGKIVNNCGADHTIYVTVLNAEGKPLQGVVVSDTYNNVNIPSGSAGVGKLKIDLWNKAMSLIVKEDVDETPYTSEQTLPLSSQDEEIPTDWLFEGGYCASMAECEVRKHNNGICRGHYSYDVTFQRTW